LPNPENDIIGISSIRHGVDYEDYNFLGLSAQRIGIL
jgi:hypothetical protein